MDTRFNYLLQKIREAPFTEAPFRHVEIDDFFNKPDLERIISAPEIALQPQQSDEGVFDTLFEAGYKIIDFPGCITNQAKYVRWHKTKSVNRSINTACEGFGVTLRLMSPHTLIISELFEFIASAEFQKTLADKFSLNAADVFYDSGIQKYLDGYEISPHPDIRRKAATFMVNVNPGQGSEKREHHTHYLRFREPYRYVQSYWESRADEDRCWVPWDWCESVKQQRANNSIVLFSPSNDSLHAVRAQYDHLQSQRTQLYGNLWYQQVPVRPGPEWEDYQIKPSVSKPSVSVGDKLKSVVPSGVKSLIKSALGRGTNSNVIANRLAKKQKP